MRAGLAPKRIEFTSPKLNVSEREQRRLLRLQEKLEFDAVDEAVKDLKDDYNRASHREAVATMPMGQKLLRDWFRPLCETIAKAQERFKGRGGVPNDALTSPNWDSHTVGPYLVDLDPEKLAVITLYTIINWTFLEKKLHRSQEGAAWKGVGLAKTGHVVAEIGYAVQRQRKMDRVRRNKRRHVDLIHEGTDYDMGIALRYKVGAMLLHNAIDALKIEVGTREGSQLEQALTLGKREYKPRWKALSKRTYGVVQWHPAVMKRLDEEFLRKDVVNPGHLPMVVPPRPWISFSEGAHFLNDCLIMRGAYTGIGPAVLQLQELAETEHVARNGKGPYYDNVLDALNVLGSTGWRINTPIFELIEKIWDEGGGIGDIPVRTNEELPQEPLANFNTSRRGHALVATEQASPAARSQFNRLKREVERRNNERHALRCDMAYKLNVAKKLRSERAFFYPHTMDFRGRAYPIHPYLHHLGSDVCRGMLTFAHGKPLGEHGLAWLKQQVASMRGGDIEKAPMEEKVAFADELMDMIIDSARQPLSGHRWWLEAEEPWQCLATCMEIERALQCDDPSRYESSLPVQQDGSCNGLQHYAALARDEVGGRSVNLLPSERPMDVYSDVCAQVKKAVEGDLHSSDAAKAEMARLTLPEVDRKLVKQTVMTSVYGVTYVGAKDQIKNRLYERGAFVDNEETRFRVSWYATRKTFEGLNKNFSVAWQVMQWLSTCAQMIARSGHAVRWRTPLGLPIVQPYRRMRGRSVNTVVQSFMVKHDSNTEPIDANKQRSAFPPNFIHSLDSSHMMLTALECYKHGLTFAGVHDSYWTHAADVQTMNSLLRNCFVELHSQPLLTDLYDSFRHTYPDVADRLPAPPDPASLDLHAVLDSKFFFS